MKYLYYILSIIISIILIPPVIALPIISHSAEEIIPGTFASGGVFKFPESLEVIGNIKIKTTTLNSILKIDSINSFSAIDFYDNGVNKWGVGKNPSNQFYISEFGLGDRLIISPGGNIGLGTNIPTQKLEVVGGIKLNSPLAQPFCDSSVRGTIWHLEGAVGLRDRVEFCLKNTDGTFTWQEIGSVVSPIDADNDGFPSFAAGGTDCVDTDAAINPGSGVTCNYGVTCTLPPPDDATCGIIPCSGRYAQTGIESSTTTETCFNKADITSNRCKDYADCKDANTADCNAQPNNAAQYSCGTCKFIAGSSCTGATLGSCNNYGLGTSCGGSNTCDGSGNCVAPQHPPQLFTIQEDISSGSDEAFGVAVDSSGFYVVGDDQNRGERQWHMEKRSLSTGSLMWTQVSFPLPNSNTANDVAVDSTGIYVVGYSQEISGVDSRNNKIIDSQWRIEKRSLSSGSLLWSQVSNPTATLDWANGVVIDSSGVYVAGHQHTDCDQWRIEKRSLSTGSLIWTQVSHPSSGNDYANDIAIDSTGIYVVGSDTSPGDHQWRIEKRSLSSGSLLWSQVSNPGSGTDTVKGVAVDSTGVYVVGPDFSPGNYQWRIEKRSLSTGSLIWSQVSNPSSGQDYAHDVAVDSTGVYIAGNDASPGNYQWRIEKRSLSTGELLWTATRNPSGSNDEGSGIATDGSGVYMVGSDRVPINMQWRIEKRDPATGTGS